MQDRPGFARVSALVAAVLIASCTGIQADSKLLFAGCGGLCIMDPAPGAMPGSLILELPEVEFIIEVAGENQVYTKGDEYPGNVSWSPDATLIALKSYWGFNGRNSVYILRSDGSELQEIATQDCCYGPEPAYPDECCDPLQPEFRSEVTWSPDGTELAFIKWGGSFEVYHSNGELARNFDPAVREYFLHPSIAWGADGKIYFSPERDRQIYTIHPDGSGLDSLGVVGYKFEVSPDGTILAYTNDYPDHKIYLMNMDSRSVAYLTHGYGPEWSPDSKQIAFQEKDGSQNRAIKIINLDGSGEQTGALADCVGFFASGFGPP